jgi:hypothetical protein
MHRLMDITCAIHIGYALTQHHLPLGFTLGEESDCGECRDALARLDGTALAFCHVSKQQRAVLNAIHEAAHAVLHVAFGHVVNFAMVADPDAAGVIGNVNFDAYDTAYNIAAASWAGHEAVLFQLDRWGALDDASRVDATYAVRGDREYMSGLGLDRGDLEACRVSAGNQVGDHWAAIERVADVLLARGRLTGDEIVEIAAIPVLCTEAGR